MRLKLICCEVFFRMASLAAATSNNVIEVEFVPMKSHVDPDKMRGQIQRIIDEHEQSDDPCDAIIVGFGLCGNTTAGLHTQKLPMVIPRAHDCCAIFLGSLKKYAEQFKHRPSAEFSAHGYFERERGFLKDNDFGKKMGLDKSYKDMVEEYGEENAKMLWETLHPHKGDEKLIYIKVEPFDSMDSIGFFNKFLEYKHEESKSDIEEKHYTAEDVEILEGSMDIINKLVSGEWGDDFLVLQPGQEIVPTYDLENVFKAREPEVC